MPPAWTHHILKQLRAASPRNGVLDPLRSLSSRPLLRASSSVPERTRKLPGAREPFGLQRWQRSFLIGVTLGAVVAPAWLLYEKNKVKDSFTAYTLVRKEPVSSTASLFYLQPVDKIAGSDVYKSAWKQGVWNVHIKQPQLQIVRAYTPLPPSVNEATSPTTSQSGSDEYLRFLIRRDQVGEVSNYIHNLPPGARLELRGPNVEYALPETTRRVVFFAGGTGVAPALQVAHAMFGDPKHPPGTSAVSDRKLHILWANRRREDCMGGKSEITPRPITPTPWSRLFTKQTPRPDEQAPMTSNLVVSELNALTKRFPGRVTVDYFVNEEDTWITAEVVQKALGLFDDKPTLTNASSDRSERQVMISGPPGFISYLAGPKEWRNGREEQGPLGKLLAHALSKRSQEVKVWKV